MGGTGMGVTHFLSLAPGGFEGARRDQSWMQALEPRSPCHTGYIFARKIQVPSCQLSNYLHKLQRVVSPLALSRVAVLPIWCRVKPGLWDTVVSPCGRQ